MKKQQLRPSYYRVTVPARKVGTEAGAPDEWLGPVEVECFDLIDALGLGFYSGNVLKYLFRLGRKTKSMLDDARKIATYGQQTLEREVQDTDQDTGQQTLEPEVQDTLPVELQCGKPSQSGLNVGGCVRWNGHSGACNYDQNTDPDRDAYTYERRLDPRH